MAESAEKTFQPFFYEHGKDFFQNGEWIYINRCTERDEQHLHAHDFIEIAYVAGGRGIHRVGETRYPVSRGDLFVINSDIPHEFRPEPGKEKQGLLVYNCVFHPRFLDQSLIHSRCFSDLFHIFLLSSLHEVGTQNDIRLQGRDDPAIGDLYGNMYEEYCGKKSGYIDMLRAYLVQLLILIFRAYRATESDEHARREKRYFNTAIRFMKEHYHEDIRLEDLAAMSFLSTSSFCTSFKKCTGVTVLKYIQQMRISEACAMLRDTDEKVFAIAQKVGYSDLKFFNQLFKSFTGMTPTGYRSRALAGPSPARRPTM